MGQRYIIITITYVRICGELVVMQARTENGGLGAPLQKY